MQEKVTHAFDPVFDKNSRILILGTMPSPKSRQNGFYYSHPQNRFWPVMAKILNKPVPLRAEEKKVFALKNGIALWDVLHSCEITGASDSSIKNPVPNDLTPIFEEAEIKAVFTTGVTANRLYQKYCQKQVNKSAVLLPSPSPANAKWKLDALAEQYKQILPYLNIPYYK